MVAEFLLKVKIYKYIGSEFSIHTSVARDSATTSLFLTPFNIGDKYVCNIR